MLEGTNSIKKIAITDEKKELELIKSHLPADVAALLASMQQATQAPLSKESLDMFSKIQNSTEPIDKAKITNTSPGLKIEVVNEIKEHSQTEMIRSVPEEVKKALELQDIIEQIKNTKDIKEKFTIYEQGVSFGIVVGKSTKAEVNEILKEISKISYENDDNELIAFYNDIYLTVLYNDEMIVREMQFGNKFKGLTAKGLKAGDHIDKAIEIYGQPKMKSVRGALWNKFGVFCENNFITSIRLMS